MTRTRAIYFDGRVARRHEVDVIVTGGRLKLVGADVDVDFPVREVHGSPRIGRTPRWLYLPNGGACEVRDRRLVHQLARGSSLERTLHRWESRPAYAALAVVLVVLGLWLLIDRGLPVVAAHIAERIPVAAETSLGKQALAGLDSYLLKPSTLPASRQDALREQFARMVRVAGAEPEPRLEFRTSPALGPNAFALPSGIIVVTDELITLARDDREVMAVLAHELGHVQHRHVMRHLLQSSATGLIIAGVTGDIASTTSIAAAAPAVLIQVKYSRESEREADRYALELLPRVDIDTSHFVAILQRLDAFGPKRRGSSFLSSHPDTDERKALALQANAGNRAGEPARESTVPGAPSIAPNSPAPAPASAAPPTLAALTDAVMPRIIGMLERREYDELDRTLSGYQAAFERDPGTSLQLEAAFGCFDRLPQRLAPNLDEWVALKGSSYAAAVARGRYLMRRGQEARGTGFASQTSKAAIGEMREYFRTATIDLDRSIALTEKPYLSHRYLLTMSRYVGSPSKSLSEYQKAIRWAPQSVETRLVYMRSLEPRWGGSDEAMEQFLAESRVVLTDPASVRRLAARIPWSRGNDAWDAKDYVRALGYYDEAVELDANAETLCYRASGLSQANRYDAALEDALRAFELSGTERDCVPPLVRAAGRASNAGRAIEVLSNVIDADPSLHDALAQRCYRYTNADKSELAFADCLRAAKLGSVWAEYQTGRMYTVGLGVPLDREQGTYWMRKAAEHGHELAKEFLERTGGGAK